MRWRTVAEMQLADHHDREDGDRHHTHRLPHEQVYREVEQDADAARDDLYQILEAVFPAIEQKANKFLPKVVTSIYEQTT